MNRWQSSPAREAPTLPTEEPVHRCGICNNGTGVYNPECPGRTKPGDNDG